MSGIAAAAVAEALDLLRGEQCRHPDRSALFAHFGDASVRRQVVRWIARDQLRSTPDIDKVLRAALVDPDWEVRMSAVIAPARLGAKGVLPDVAQAKLPRTSREGLDRDDRRVLELLRRAAMAALADAPPENLTNTGVDPVVADRLVALVRDRGTQVTDRISLLVHALAEPADCGRIRPPDVDRIVDDEDAYRLVRSGVRLRWIAPVPHVVVTDVKNPSLVRSAMREGGFFITERVLDGDPRDASDALQCALAIGFRDGVRAAIPTLDEWTMAALGPDGRRFPWGNGVERADDSTASPWGVQQVAGVDQWVLLDGGAMAAVRGDRLGRGKIAPAEPGCRAGVRLVVKPA